MMATFIFVNLLSHHFMTNRRGKSGAVTDFLFLDSKITADGDCSHEIKRRLLLRRKAMTNLDSILKIRDITLLTKVCIVKAILPRSKCLLISWLQSPSSVILECKNIKSVAVSIFSPSICHEMMGPDAIIAVFSCSVSSQVFHSPLSRSSRGSLVPLHSLPLKWYYLNI